MRILLLANASSPVLRTWFKLAEKNDLLVLSIKDRGEQVPVDVKTQTIKSRFGVFFSYLKLLMKIRKISKEFKSDLIISHYTTTYSLLTYLSRLQPHISVIYGSDIYQASKFFKPLIKQIFLKSKKIIVSTQDAKNHVVNKYRIEEEKFIVHSYGINVRTFNIKKRLSKTTETNIFDEFNFESSGKYFFSARCMTPIYNQNLIVETFGKLSDKYPDYKLILLHCYRYDAEYLKKIKDIVQKYNIEDKIVWITRGLNAQEMSDIFSISDVFISIPKSDQLATTLLEGIASGCFPIVADLKPYYEVINNGINGIITSINSKKLSEALEFYMENKKFFTENSLKKAREILKRFSNLNFINILEKKMEDLD